jgi:tetratricopeptide (TPR) repeat protein
MTSGISLCMIVRNEERFLDGALASVQGVVDEICIVDTGSTDDTLAIAERYGARVTHLPWTDDFSAARNAALAMASRRWILVLDADERLAPESRDELRALGTQPTNGRGRWIWCRNLVDVDRRIAASTNAIVRIFPNDPAVRYRGRLHEFVARSGEEFSLEADRTKIEILHLGYQPAIIAERDKGRRNLQLSRAEVEAHPSDPAHLYNYAMSAALAGERDVAVEQLERVIALTDGTPRGFRPQALTMLSTFYLEAERFADALAAAESCVAIVPSLPDAHFARGRALAALDRLHEARDAFGAAIANGSTGGEHFIVEDEIPAWKAHSELAATLAREERFADARRWLELALVNRPAERTLILNHAHVCEKMGDLEAALIGFRAAAEGFRDEAAVTTYVNFVFRHGSPEICLAAVEGVLPIVDETNQRAFLASAAAIMLRAGRRAEARDILARVRAVGPDPATAEPIVAALASHYGTPELADLFALAAPAAGASGGSP